MFERLRELLRARAFEPFRVYLNSGRHFDVRHPEFMSLGRSIAHIVLPEDGEASDHLAYVQVRNITRAELLHETQGQP